MRRWLAFPISLWFSLGALPAQPLPGPSEEPFEVEPQLLVPEPTPAAETRTAASSATVAELARQLERAKHSASWVERLFRAGVLAKVDAEKSALRVVHLQADLAAARLDEARAKLAKPKGVVEIGQNAEKRAADPRLAGYASAAEKAAAELHRAELDAAAMNLRRQKRLLALGSGRKADVRRAEEKLAALKQAQR